MTEYTVLAAIGILAVLAIAGAINLIRMLRK